MDNASIYSFTIPSVYDKVSLECRLIHPEETHNTDSGMRRKAAIVAHPYAPLGGCFDDRIVKLMANELLNGGYIVGIFNQRGAGNSGGRTSWTAKPELADYISFYGFMITYLCNLDRATELSASSSEERTVREGVEACPGSETGRTDIILSGYSFGSMIGAILEIRDIALKLVAQSSSTKKHGHNVSDEQMECSIPTTRYLLVSPILPPISQLVTLSFASSDRPLSTSAEGFSITGLASKDALANHSSLAIYGDSDGFTSVRKLRAWSQELSAMTNSQHRFLEIHHAGHFWCEDGVEISLRNAIREYIDSFR